MSKLARNALALGTVTMIVTAGIQFSANGADEKFTYKSYGEAQFVAAGGALGDALLDPLGDFLEAGSVGAPTGVPAASAKVNTPTTAEKVGPNFPSGPLDPLGGLTGPIGDLLGSGGASAISSYAVAERDSSTALSGLVTDQGGLVDVDTIPDADEPDGLQLALTGPSSPLAPLNGVLDATLELPVASSRVELKENAPAAPLRDYSIAGGSITAELPAVDDISEQLGGLDAIGDLSAGALPIAGVSVNGVGDLLTSITTLTGGGLTIDLQTSTVTLDIEDLVNAALAEDNLGSINDQPENTALLPLVLDGIALAIPKIVTDLNTETLDAVKELSIDLTLAGVTTPIELGNAVDPIVTTLQGLVNGVVNTVVGPALQTAITDTVTPLVTQLEDVIDLRINVWETSPGGGYRGLVDERTGTAGIYSVTGLRLALLGAAGNGGLADVYLGNSLVGANSRAIVAPPTTPTPTSTTPTPTRTTPTPNSDGPSSDSDSGSTPIVDNVDDSDTVADADAQADADVTTTLPSTGAPNLLPFWLLGIALLLFGGAVLLNEKRRLNQI